MIKKLIIRAAAVYSLMLLGTAVAGGWEYETKQDKMSSTNTKFATITSENSLDLPFPYGGHNKGFLYIRKNASKPVDVFVSLMKGQIPCPGYMDGCTVTVRFDEDRPLKFRAVNPSDHSTDTFFIHDTARFINGAKKAKTILIQFTMFQAGNQILEFKPTTPLSWDEPKRKK